MANSHKTAIARRSLSAPARYLQQKHKLQGRLLDYGSGKGTDAEILQMAKYDPFYCPTMPQGLFDTILCTYVLNVIPEEEANQVISDIRSKLRDEGKAYISVRRDLIKEGVTKAGTLQRNVILDFPITFERKKHFCIYEVNPERIPSHE